MSRNKLRCQNFSRYRRRLFSSRCRKPATVTLTLKCPGEETAILKLCNICAEVTARDARRLGWSAALKKGEEQ